MKNIRRRAWEWVCCAGFAGSLLALTPLGVRAQNTQAAREMNQPAAPFRILGNVYYVGASDVASYLIATREGNIILDGGFAETAPQIEANIQTLGFKTGDVKILLNSHAHFDHAGGLAELKDNSGAKLFAMDGDAGLLASGGRGDFFFGDTELFPPVAPDRVIHDGDTVSLGGTTLTAHRTAGHTRGCTTWTMTANEAGKDYNVVFVCSASVLDGYQLVYHTSYPGIAEDYEKSFRIWKTLPCDVFLGAHGQFFNLTEKRKELMSGAKENPFIDPAGYEAYVSRNEADFRAELNREKAMAPNIESATPGMTAHHTEADVMQVEQDWLDALRSRDMKALDRILAEDWLDHSSQGTVVTRKDFFSGGAAPSTGKPGAHIASQYFENTGVRFYGDVAIATGTVVTEYESEKTENLPARRVLYTDVLVWRDGRWQAVSSQETLAAPASAK